MTDPDKVYSLYYRAAPDRQGRSGYLALKANGKLFHKCFLPGAGQYHGGPELDKFIKENPGYEPVTPKPSQAKKRDWR